jgi:hypothetical protein
VQKFAWLICLSLARVLFGQEPSPTPKPVQEVDPGSETGKLKKSCPVSSVPGCLEVLFTGQPVHIAVGSIAPQNGFAAGLAYVDGHNNISGNWRNSWSADGVVSPNLSWRTGVYFKFVDSRVKDVGIQKGTKGIGKNPEGEDEQPVITTYAQTITLNKIMFFGMGPHSALAGRSFFGMREAIAGASIVKPLNDHVVNAGLYAELNSRWVQIRAPGDSSLPSTQALYNEATAPGLTTQPFFLQFGAGARIHPDLGRLHLDYDVALRPYIAVTDSHFTFARFTADLQHEFQFYGRGFPLQRANKGPDDCSGDSQSDPNSLDQVPARVKTCSTQYTRDKVGTIDVRFLTSLAGLTGSSGVPFYLQSTLGGSDINGISSLAAYTDYRFRAPDILLTSESFEHSLGKWPLGILLTADQGKVALAAGDLGSNPWVHTFGGGITLRAGGFPMVSVVFAWGHEGTHVLANVNNALLGSSARPSLF